MTTTKDGVEVELGMKLYQFSVSEYDSGASFDVYTVTKHLFAAPANTLRDFLKHWYADKNKALIEAIEYYEDEIANLQELVDDYHKQLT